MKGQRDIIKDIVVVFLAELFEAVKKVLFVSQQSVVLYMVMSHLNMLSLLGLHLFEKWSQIIKQGLSSAFVFNVEFVLVCQNPLQVFIEKYFLVVLFLYLYLSTNNNRLLLDLDPHLWGLKVLKVGKYFFFWFLCPDQVGLTLIISKGPPKPVSKNGFNQLGVVSLSYKYSIPFGLQLIILHPETVVDQS